MIDETTMEHRRLERLSRLTFFMVRAKLSETARYALSLSAAHCLLTGFFQNSDWAVAWYCVKEAAQGSWMKLRWRVSFCWQARVLRLSEEEVTRRLFDA